MYTVSTESAEASRIQPIGRTQTVTKPGEAKLNHLFQPGKIGKFEVKNRIKYGACCVSNYNGRDGTITPRELARVRVIAGTGCGLITNQGAPLSLETRFTLGGFFGGSRVSAVSTLRS